MLGVKSSTNNETLTLDKLNKKLRLHVRNTNIKLKIIQTHKEYIALNFIQRNRNKANGLIIIPTSWAKYNQTILETIVLSNMKTATVYFDEPYNLGTSENESILISKNIRSFVGDPIKSITTAIDYIKT
jgi:3-dehydroquinate dehydratase